MKQLLKVPLFFLVASSAISLECCQDEEQNTSPQKGSRSSDIENLVLIKPAEPLAPLVIPPRKKKPIKLEVSRGDLIWEKPGTVLSQKEVKKPPQKKPPPPPTKKKSSSPSKSIPDMSPFTKELCELAIDPEAENHSGESDASPFDEWNSQLLATISRLKKFLLTGLPEKKYTSSP